MLIAVPLQPAVPPPVADVLTIDRHLRLFDLATNVPEVVARNAGLAASYPGLGAFPGALSFRGSPRALYGDVRYSLDGIHLEVPLARRGLGASDLDRVPIQALGRLTTDPGPGTGGFAGVVTLERRRLVGLDAELLVGGRERAIGVSAGTAHVALDDLGRGDPRPTREGLAALELRQVPLSGTSGELLGSGYFAGELHLDGGFSVFAAARAHSSRDDAAGLAPDAFASGLAAAPTDAGAHDGLSAALRLSHQGPDQKLSAQLQITEDRERRFATLADGQHERRERHRVIFGDVVLDVSPPCDRETSIRGGLSLVADEARFDEHLTLAQERQATLPRRRADLVMPGAHLDVERELFMGLSARARGALSQATLKLVDPLGLGTTEAATTSEYAPDLLLELTYELPSVGVRLRGGQSHRLHPEALDGGPLVLAHDGGELSFFGTLAPAEGVALAWRAAGLANRYGAAVLTPVDAEDDPLVVMGAEAGLEATFADSGLVVAARGGPLWVLSEDAPDAAAVPRSILHLGILRPRERGLVFELWLDAYGLGQDERPQALPRARAGVVELSGRVGYKGRLAVLWLGAKNLLDDDSSLLRLEDGFLPRQERSVFVLLAAGDST